LPIFGPPTEEEHLAQTASRTAQDRANVEAHDKFLAQMYGEESPDLGDISFGLW